MEVSSSVVRRIRPTGYLPFVAWALLLFMQIISPARAWSWLLVAMSALLLLSYWWARQLRDQVSAGRSVSGAWVVAGDQLRERFTLRNQGRLPALWAHVRDLSAVPGYHPDRVESVAGGAEHKWTSSGVCERRGVFRLGPWDLRMGDPFGFFEVTQHYPDTTTLMVYPRASHLPHLELPRGHATSRANRSERIPLETITIGGLREYTPGDSLRRVHWRKSAQHSQLLVREFDREPSGDVWVVVDLDEQAQAGSGAEATQEYAITLAASLTTQLARSGENRAVGLVTSGRSPALLAPARGQAQEWRILRALAEAEPAPGASLAHLLEELGGSLGGGRTVVIITPSQDPGWVAELLGLAGRGNAPAVLLLDSTSFDPPRGDNDRLESLRTLLAGQRIPHYVLQQGFAFRPLDRIRRQRRELRTLAGTGRVVEVEVEEEV